MSRRPSTQEPVLLGGATGLIGGLALTLLSQSRRPVLAPTRRALTNTSAHLQSIVADLSDPAGDAALAGQLRTAASGPLGAYLCCLGTTLKAAGSRAAFEAVDHGLVLRWRGSRVSSARIRQFWCRPSALIQIPETSTCP